MERLHYYSYYLLLTASHRHPHANCFYSVLLVYIWQVRIAKPINYWLTNLVFGPLMAIRGSWKVLLNGTPMQEPPTLVTPTNSGLCEHGSSEENTRTKNCTGTLLRGTVAVGEGKSSIWRATAYHPFLPTASYWSWHFLYNERFSQEYLIIQT